MRINFAHIRERSTTGGWINFAVFDARSTLGTNEANAEVLTRLTAKVRISGLEIDQAALAYIENRRMKFFGTPNLVSFLSKTGVPNWTHHIDD